MTHVLKPGFHILRAHFTTGSHYLPAGSVVAVHYVPNQSMVGILLEDGAHVYWFKDEIAPELLEPWFPGRQSVDEVPEGTNLSVPKPHWSWLS